MTETLAESERNLAEVRQDAEAGEHLKSDTVREVVADKGYHSNETLKTLRQEPIRTYISEPKYKGRRRWQGKAAEQEAVYANRPRIRGTRGKALLRKRGELVERPFAHCYDTGGMRRTHLKGHAKILKHLLVHVAGCNLALVMRTRFGLGTPRGLQGLLLALIRAWLRRVRALWRHEEPTGRPLRRFCPFDPTGRALRPRLANL